jgi:hypothetical protein
LDLISFFSLSSLLSALLPLLHASPLLLVKSNHFGCSWKADKKRKYFPLPPIRRAQDRVVGRLIEKLFNQKRIG